MSRYVIKLNPPARYSIKYAKGTGPQGPSGVGLTPAANNTLIGNVSGSTATPTALSTSAVKTLLGYTTASEVDAALLAALVNLIVAGPGITATFNPSTVQWTISVSASGSIGTAIIGSTFIVG